MPRSRSSARGVTTVAGAGVLALAFAASLGTGAAHAATNGNTRVAVAGGVNVSAIPGAKAFGNTDPNTPEQVSFILKERHKGSLEAQVEHGVRHQLSVSQFARSYGQSERTIHELSSYLSSFGITTHVYADRVDVTASGTAGEFDKALGTHQKNFKVPAQRGKNGLGGIPAQTVHGTTGQPRLPRHVAQSILAVLGLTNYGPFSTNARHAASTTGTRPAAGSSEDSCVKLTGVPDGCNTPTDYVRRYGLAGTERRGNIGTGRTIGIVTLAALDQGAPEYFWSNIMHLPKTGRTVSVQNIDGGPGAPSDAAGTGETDLDVEQSGGVAPGANVIVYQAPNTDNGFADAFFSAATQNTADSVSASWGESETIIQAFVSSGLETPQYQAAFDEAFLEMGAQGQSAFASAGDSGAYDASNDLKTTNLSVDSPADSPFITSAGGTTLPWQQTRTNKSGVSATISVQAERAWGWDYLWAPLAKLHGEPESTLALTAIGGGGGGFSTMEPEPSYQRGLVRRFSAVPYLTPTNYQKVDGINEPTAWDFNGSPSVVTGNGTGRAEPDVSADADPETGYLLYEPSAPAGTAALQGAWGGTSFVAPQFNGSTAVIDQALGRRVGFWNPTVYGLATSWWRSPVKPLNTSGTSNDNLYYTGTRGTLYNPASGLGVPDFGKLVSDLQHW